SDVMSAEIAALYESRDSLAIKQGNKVVREEMLARPDGSNEYFLTTRFPTRDSGGNVSGLGLISTDITDRKLAELALEEGEQQLRTITDNLPVLIARHGRDWGYRFINREGASWYGSTPSQIVGKTISDILSVEVCEAIRPMVEAVLSGETARYSGSIDYPDGKTRNVLIDYVPDRSADGSVQGWFAVAQDTTERELAAQALSESEAQMRTIADNLPVFIAYIDNELRYGFVNSTVEKWYGRSSRDIIGRKISDIVLSETYRRLLPRMEAVLSGQAMIFEDSLIYPDGVSRAVEMTWIPDMDEAGKARGWFALIHDITERKRLEGELLGRERLAIMGQLTGTVAHELRNPLGAVATSITALRRRSMESGLDMERSLSRAERGISRCDRIITELLDFARAKGLQREPTRFGEWLAAVVADQDIPAGISLSINRVDGDIEVMIDREDLRRAVINVIDNACQAVGEISGGGRIEIGFGVKDGRLECDIRDNGPGISADSLERVMEPLFSTKSFGTGLGLPTVQRIIEGHGGGITIDSNPGQGTLVHMWLPLDAASIGGTQE
ncbi:MAG: PAS domain-containing protein, partial [Alphaproteobacteria bacterium]|nr:PAS domain-containing protein [Alphaproteobacteria bacterium]